MKFKLICKRFAILLMSASLAVMSLFACCIRANGELESSVVAAGNGNGRDC